MKDIRSEILLDADLVAGGTEQEDGSVRYEWTLDKIEEALEFLAAALIEAGQDHRLADPEPLAALLRAVDGMQGPA